MGKSSSEESDSLLELQSPLHCDVRGTCWLAACTCSKACQRLCQPQCLSCHTLQATRWHVAVHADAENAGQPARLRGFLALAFMTLLDRQESYPQWQRLLQLIRVCNQQYPCPQKGASHLAPQAALPTSLAKV